MGLGDLDVSGVLELAQVDGEVAGGHPQRVLEAGEGDLVVLAQHREGGNHPRPGLGVDDGVELGAVAHRCLDHQTRPASSMPPPPAIATISECQPGPATMPITLITLVQAPRKKSWRSFQIAAPAMCSAPVSATMPPAQSRATLSSGSRPPYCAKRTEKPV